MRSWLTFFSVVLLLGVTAGAASGDQKDPQLDALFAQLQNPDSSDVRATEAEIWRRWLASGDDRIDGLMDGGVSAMNARDYAAALAAMNTIVEAAPDFAEGWNKRATLYWMMGDYEASIDDIDRTLALEPRHFGALSGLAMIRDAQGQPDRALEAFDRALAVHPHMAGADIRRQMLERQLGEPI